MLLLNPVLAALIAAALAYPAYWSGQYGTCYAYTGVAPVVSDHALRVGTHCVPVDGRDVCYPHRRLSVPDNSLVVLGVHAGRDPHRDGLCKLAAR